MGEKLTILGFINQLRLKAVPVIVVLVSPSGKIYGLWPSGDLTPFVNTDEERVKNQENFISFDKCSRGSNDCGKGEVAYYSWDESVYVGMIPELIVAMKKDLPKIDDEDHRFMLANIIEKDEQGL